MTTIELVRGDKNFELLFTIYDSDNNPLDLTEASSVYLKYKSYIDGQVRAIRGTVVDAAAGQVVFHVGSEFENAVGVFKAEIEIVYTSGKVLTAPNIIIKVIPDLR